MSKGFDFFSDDIYEDGELTPQEYAEQRSVKKLQQTARIRKIQYRITDEANEVGVAPPLTPEIIEKRERYKNDFVALHQEVFTESTGLKPFGKVQIDSIRLGQAVFHQGGRLLKLEPRGYGKTTRLTNESLYSILTGLQDYIVIVCSSVKKAEEILESIRTELTINDALLELFPGPIACFRHAAQSMARAGYQTYGGVPTQIKMVNNMIRFPIVEGEPSSSKFIEVRPLKNLKGLNHKVKGGPMSGKVLRPTLFVFDDPQTHGDAKNDNLTSTIVSLIKRDALRAGSHARRASAVMAITPVAHGDVAYRFLYHENWEVVEYKMLEKLPDNHDMWLDEYASILSNYNKRVPGSMMAAKMKAKEYVEKNYDLLHKGAEPSWEWAYGWGEDPQTEISAVQHAYNIILEEGWETFEYECQCNINYGLYEEGDQIHADTETIKNRVNVYPRRAVPQEVKSIVTHIDVNKDILTWATIGSADPFRGYVLDYGVHPKQPGTFSKRNIGNPLKAYYNEVSDYREVLYLACKDLLQTIAQMGYIREDGVTMHNNAIGIDIRFEEDYILRACKDANLFSLVIPCWGIGVGPDDELLHERPYPEGTKIYPHCVEKSNRANTYDYLNVDTNYFKTELHKAFNQTPGIYGSLTLFAPEYLDQHEIIGRHCNAEAPERKPGIKTDKTRVVWKELSTRSDNEYLDNLANSLALLQREGIQIHASNRSKPTQQEKSIDMAEYMRLQESLDL